MVRFSAEGHKRRYEVQKESVLRFFSKPENWDIVYEQLQGEQRLSKRFWDHLVTDYARTHNCQYMLEDEDGNTRTFNIYHEAQTVLSAVHKKHMDPFKRQNDLVPQGGFFLFGHAEKEAVTSVNELTFFRWAIRNRVLEYGKEHEKEIKADMAEVSQKKKRRFKSIEEKDTITGISLDLTRKEEGEEFSDDSEDELIKETNRKAAQQPAKKRRRHRENRVNTLFNEKISLRVVFGK